MDLVKDKYLNINFMIENVINDDGANVILDSINTNKTIAELDLDRTFS